MFADNKLLKSHRPDVGAGGLAARFAAAGEPAALPEAGEEEACPAFGFLRGARERAVTIEFRLRDGNAEAFP
ncbi:MAG: hypothetical protein K2X87_16340 [Gemmataceae bacterium]|nr:hypothetical protein [Gemmataceae bacterium]